MALISNNKYKGVDNMKNYNIELNKNIWEHLRTYLQQNNIYYETSGIKRDLLHIELRASEAQAQDINLYLDFIYTIC